MLIMQNTTNYSHLAELVKTKKTSTPRKHTQPARRIAQTNKLISAMQTHAPENITRTENGAKTFKSTTSSVLDFFANGAALRTRSAAEIETILEKALGEDPQLALRVLFYIADVRGGQGERRTFNIALKYLGTKYPEYLDKVVQLIPEYNRWDSLFSLLGTSLEPRVIQIIQDQLTLDCNNAATGKPVSLLAKWMKSTNTSSQSSRQIGRHLAHKLGYSEAVYRKLLSGLRDKINIVERQMTAQEWTSINYATVPSKAHTNYRKAFGKHDAEGYKNYLGRVKKGEAKICASTLYPYGTQSRCISQSVHDLQYQS